MPTPSRACFELTGGALCLDFANTLADRPRCRAEQLPDYGALVAWARQAGAVGSASARRLARAAAAEPAAAREAHAEAVLLRETLYRLFGARRRGERPAAADLARVNAWLARALGRQRLVAAGAAGRLAWAWAEPAEDLTRPLWPVVRSAAELLSSEAAAPRLRECASQTCSWLFLDTSRTQRRRWCDMRTCGNRAKARRHYARVRQAATPGGAPREPRSGSQGNRVRRRFTPGEAG